MNTKFKWIAAGIGIAGVISTLAYFLHKTCSERKGCLEDMDNINQPNNETSQTDTSKYDVDLTQEDYTFSQNVSEPFSDSYTTTSVF